MASFKPLPRLRCSLPGINSNFPELFHFKAEIALRALDLDNRGHLSSQTLLMLMNECWVKFLRSMECQNGKVDGAGTVMTHASLIHEAPCPAVDALVIEMTAGEFSSASCDLFYRITNAANGALIARAMTSIGFIDPETERPSAVPERFRTRFA